MLKPVNARVPALFVLLTSLLTACPPAPSAPVPKASEGSNISTVTFYPYQNGLEWRYLSPGDPVTLPPYVRKATGATLLGDLPVQTSNQVGRGTDTTWYRTYSEGGVFLNGIAKPGLKVLISPAWREYPASSEWRPGLRWSGSSTLTVLDETGKERQKLTGSYVYTVLEQRDVTVNGLSYRVWVVNRQIAGEAKNLFPDSSDFWFVPYVGEVKTPEGLLLLGTNFKSK